ncbi:Oidioi.mRNA.OKI2018_I69.XSR.g15375.t2.cds [Oikopleura dioica]|uniref:Oidioi.mRNA.OKI2018_I69.XSR.g15375.t2.cds n=1 Tax=Oikopleura dioica TaxID=34765 RepID=A0ABN7SGP2_OIKDI|nr:Oidioi.mRNA.OKI2018_I69.XSR.g15375.t2.cds [Oikopleura dioica]
MPGELFLQNETYICDDRIMLQSLKDDPASNECCTWSDHQIECGQCTGAMKYLGLTKGKCSWDRTFGDIYEFPSNDGKKYDTSFCNIKTDFDEASQICSLLGGRLFNEEKRLICELCQENDIDCSSNAIAYALNMALAKFTKNIPLKPSNKDMAIAFDYGANLFKTVQLEDITSETDGFICERPEWSCQYAGCSHICNDDGFCECPTGYYLEDRTTCRQEGAVERVECFNSHMVAWFKSESVSFETVVALNDPNCGDKIRQVGNMLRVDVPLDGCGTTLEYDEESNYLIFTNTLKAVVDDSKSVSIMSQIDKTFSCSYETVSTIDENSLNFSSASKSLDGTKAGSFDFKITTYSTSSFQEMDAAALNRVGETLYFAVEPISALSNLVYTVNQCEVFSEAGLSYELFNISEQRADDYVKLRRFPFYFSDSHGPTCAVSLQDRWSYTVFQFYDLSNPLSSDLQQQFLKCSVIVCKKEEDMDELALDFERDFFTLIIRLSPQKKMDNISISVNQSHFFDSPSQSELMGAPLNYDLSNDYYEDYSLEQMFCTFYPMELDDSRNFSKICFPNTNSSIMDNTCLEDETRRNKELFRNKLIQNIVRILLGVIGTFLIRSSFTKSAHKIYVLQIAERYFGISSAMALRPRTTSKIKSASLSLGAWTLSFIVVLPLLFVYQHANHTNENKISERYSTIQTLSLCYEIYYTMEAENFTYYPTMNQECLVPLLEYINNANSSEEICARGKSLFNNVSLEKLSPETLLNQEFKLQVLESS